MLKTKVNLSKLIWQTVMVATVAGVMAGCSDGSDKPDTQLPDNEFSAIASG